MRLFRPQQDFLLPGGLQSFRLSLLPSQAILVDILVDFGCRSDLVTISIHCASRRYCIAVVATPGSLRRETAVFGPRAARK